MKYLKRQRNLADKLIAIDGYDRYSKNAEESKT